jgi:hypothetical protein
MIQIQSAGEREGMLNAKTAGKEKEICKNNRMAS